MTEGHRGGFWTTLPGLFTGAAALVTAITGAAMVMRGDGPATAPSKDAPRAEPTKGQAANDDASVKAVTALASETKSAAVEAESTHEDSVAPEPQPPVERFDALTAALRLKADEMNKAMPVRANEYMVQTAVTAQGRMLVFHFKLDEQPLAANDLRQLTYTLACDDASNKPALDLGVTIRFRYVFEDEKPVVADVTRALCDNLV